MEKYSKSCLSVPCEMFSQFTKIIHFMQHRHECRESLCVAHSSHIILVSPQEVQGHTGYQNKPLMQSLKAANQANGAPSLKTQPTLVMAVIPQNSDGSLGGSPRDSRLQACSAHSTHTSSYGWHLRGRWPSTSKTISHP